MNRRQLAGLGHLLLGLVGTVVLGPFLYVAFRVERYRNRRRREALR